MVLKLNFGDGVGVGVGCMGRVAVAVAVAEGVDVAVAVGVGGVGQKQNGPVLTPESSRCIRNAHPRCSSSGVHSLSPGLFSRYLSGEGTGGAWIGPILSQRA